MKLTHFGKEVRKLRIDRNLILKDMADALGMSAAFLSAIETGKKSVPAGFVPRLAAAYGLSNDVVQHLNRAADLTKSTFELRMPPQASMAHREAAVALARTFAGLDDAKAKQILAMLEEE